MDDLIQVHDRWYVLATSSRADDRTCVLKEGETFGIFDRFGDIQALGIGKQGLFHEGTRYLSRLELTVNKSRPLLLNSAVREDNMVVMVDLTTPDIYHEGRVIIRNDTLHLFRSLHIAEGVLHERLRLVNYGDQPAEFQLGLEFDADFMDIFEVRGVMRRARGERLATRRNGRELVFGYRGLDQILRQTRITTNADPNGNDPDRALSYSMLLAPGAARELYCRVQCLQSEQQADPQANDGGQPDYAFPRCIEPVSEGVADVHTSNEQFNAWFRRSAADLRMLTTVTPLGPYPYAGVPWYSTPFGRDGIITALQTLWVQPELARGVLNYLAAMQAGTAVEAQDAEPGKILHEARGGEMANLDEIPFRRYYGTADATPLFIVLAEAYYARTGDQACISRLWPHIERALHWIDHYGDADGDGFVEYSRHSANGLIQQGWKDSADSVFHRDGQLATAPIALCEVQGYVYAAKHGAAKLAAVLGHLHRAAELIAQAERLKMRFNDAFWSDEINTYALALDAAKRPCLVATSNAGHALYTGIATPDYARAVAETLLTEDSFSGWGIRTVAGGQTRYNPMSYHNGSVWPHDNALIAMGLARYGFQEQAIKIFTGLFEASVNMDLHRLPELFCGFPRRTGQGPTLYPVACSPQAWASGTVFLLLQACLGLTFSFDRPQLRFRYPRLPDFLQWVELRNIRFNNASIDIVFRQQQDNLAASVLRKDEGLEAVVVV